MLRERVRFLWRAFRRGLPSLLSALGAASVIVGGSLLAALTLALDRPVIAALIVAVVAVLTFGEGAYRLHRAANAALEKRTGELRRFEAGTPQLSFDRAVIPERSEPIHVFLPEMGGQPKSIGPGRVIRVPVVNAHGAGEAKEVHARLTFLPDDRDGQFSPRHPAQGEWLGESGPEVVIDLPGNGRPRMINVVVVLDGQYPHAHEWTTASRQAALRGYAIEANPIQVDIEVMGRGSGPNLPDLRGRLSIRLDKGIIAADWASAGPHEATNWVAWR